MNAAKSLAWIGLSVALGGSARGDVVVLLDGTRMNAELVHFYDGAFTFSVAGQTTKVAKSKVRSIQFALPDPRSVFSTPRKTFDEWQAALQARDIARMVECYALVYQAMAAKEFESLSAEDREAMWQQAQGMQLKWESVETRDAQAVAQIRAVRGKETVSGKLHFVKENGEWKMTPLQLAGVDKGKE